MDRAWGPLRNLKCFLAILGGKHRVAGRTHKFGCQFSNSFFIFRDKHCRGSTDRRSKNILSSSRLCSFLDTRQIDFKAGSLTWLRLHPNASSALLYNAINSGKAQSGSFPLLLGREEWLENPGPCHSIHSLARICNCQQHVRPGVDGRARSSPLFIHCHVMGLDRELAPFWHTVALLHSPIDNYLSNLPRISFHSSQSLPPLKLTDHLFAHY